tara:strand:- start:12 stop:293 length:282 start_codon:yes stop_codon:yes gene_type:complete
MASSAQAPDVFAQFGAADSMSPAGDVDHGSRDSAGSPDLDSCGPSFREIEATVATGTLDAVKLAFRVSLAAAARATGAPRKPRATVLEWTAFS